MNPLPLVGGAGVGLVWGWLAGAWTTAVHPWRVAAALALAAVLSALVIWYVAGTLSAVTFAAGAAASAFSRIAWQRQRAAAGERPTNSR